MEGDSYDEARCAESRSECATEYDTKGATACFRGSTTNPYGYDDLYSTQPTERMPRDPMEGDTVLINATSWPIESGQTVWITWTKNGVAQPVIGASWQYNDGNNSYWQASLDRQFAFGYT